MTSEILLPLFPLPNLVFFPGTRMPLHIFEPRYRQLVGDVLAGDSRFGIILPKPGWEADYYGTPPLHLYGTLGTIEHSVTLDDGRFNILVHGDVRFRLVGLVSDSPYRVARVVEDPERVGNETDAVAERERLAELSRQYLEYLPDQMEVPELGTASLGALTNALIMSLGIDVEAKQRLLEVGDMIDRSRQTGAELERRIESLRFLKPFRKDFDPSRN
ncbi:MAG TPA: LON peptidase substrate-binding domain-containing protein [Thermoanaerobaculia bacterium]|nr:LON peptidase substrate-binding domain-containing protein [Thermoanaerobaculia bacterium]